MVTFTDVKAQNLLKSKNIEGQNGIYHHWNSFFLLSVITSYNIVIAWMQVVSRWQPDNIYKLVPPSFQKYV